MQLSLFITSHGKLTRDRNSILFVNEDGKKAVPIAQVSDIHIFGKVSISSGTIDLFSEHNIPIHFYNQYGYHISSLLPKDHYISGKVLLAQAEAVLDREKRSEVVVAILEATRRNMIHVLKHYSEKDESIQQAIAKLEETTIPRTSVETLLGIEANLWKKYYSCITPICPALPFERRSFRPPENEMNSLISLANTMLYNSVLTQIQQTYLSPALSFLHESTDRRFSLSLDIAEYYKPLIHQMIFKLVNTKQVTQNSFETGFRLKQKAFSKFASSYQQKLDEVHTYGKKKATLRSVIRYDLHRLVKSILGDREFKPYILRR